jgi:hypothetical protein
MQHMITATVQQHKQVKPQAVPAMPGRFADYGREIGFDPMNTLRKHCTRCT